ncbi:MAG TPA: XapX domain-containing protein [Burkholderiaceae bacterium]
MKPYLVSLAIGLLVGVIYALFNVRSPAPPVIALVGLLGILVGEQIPPLVKQVWKTEQTSWLHDQVKPHVFGRLPQCKGAELKAAATQSRSTRSTEHTHG